MANDRISLVPSPAHSRFDEIVFLAFLLLAFVGLAPFHPPPPQIGSLPAVATSGAGDFLRQLCYLVVLGGVVLGALRQRGLQAFSTLPLFLLVLLFWCILSALWSPEPGVTIRRSGLAFVLVVAAMLSVETLGCERSLKLWRWVLLAVLIVNLVSIRFIPAAVHPPGEADAALVGAWRGLYSHKNIAGSASAMTALVFLFTPRQKYWHKAFDVAVAAAAIFFTVMTRSKSSLGLVAVALLAGGVYGLAWKREIDRTIAVIAGGLLLVAAAVFVVVDQGAITRLFSDPEQFTGRTEIWRAEAAFIRDHLIFGAGFGTFSDTGGVSPLHNYVGGWVTEASHGHNGYLQIFVTTGLIGFVLALAALIVAPAIGFWKRGSVALKALLFALFVFLLLHNLMETDFLEGDGVAWVAYLLMLAMLGDLRRKPA
jgi:exopolysaccharide production protein ExoQ